MSRPRLLVLSSTFPRWHCDHEPPFVFELARRLTDRFEVTVLAPHAPGAAHREVMDGITVQRFRYAPTVLQRLAYDGGIPTRLRRHPWLALLLPGFLLSQWIHTRRLVRQLQPHTIHAHWVLPQGLMAVMCRHAGSARPRLLVTAHGADLQGLDFPLGRWLKRWTLRHADAVTVVSRALADRVAALLDCADKLTVLPMGVDLTTAFVPAAQCPADRSLVFAGRLVEKKGLQQLLAAMPKVLEHFPDCRLLVAGDGPLRAALQEQARQLGIDGQVDFLGRYRNDQLPAILGRASLAVFPFQVAAGGDQEGLGLVTIEAMGCGLPVVVGDVPAVHDVVSHRATGLIARPGDSDDLARQILRLLEDPALAARLADAGRRQALARFDWRAVAEAYAQLLSP